MVGVSKLPVLASAQSNSVRPNKLSCFEKIVQSILEIISVVSNCRKQSAPTLFFNSSLRMLLYFIFESATF
jgi:hypothetical protein